MAVATAGMQLYASEVTVGSYPSSLGRVEGEASSWAIKEVSPAQEGWGQASEAFYALVGTVYEQSGYLTHTGEDYPASLKTEDQELIGNGCDIRLLLGHDDEGNVIGGVRLVMGAETVFAHLYDMLDGQPLLHRSTNMRIPSYQIDPEGEERLSNILPLKQLNGNGRLEITKMVSVAEAGGETPAEFEAEFRKQLNEVIAEHVGSGGTVCFYTLPRLAGGAKFMLRGHSEGRIVMVKGVSDLMRRNDPCNSMLPYFEQAETSVDKYGSGLVLVVI